MSLVPVIGKYVVYLASLGTSVGSFLIYSKGGGSLGGGNKREELKSPSESNVALQRQSQEQKTERLDNEKISLEHSVEKSSQRGISSNRGAVSQIKEKDSQKNEKEEKTEKLKEPTPKAKGEESKKLEKEQIDEFLEPFFKTLETPLYYRGYMNFINRVRMTLPKDIIEKAESQWEYESKEGGIDSFIFSPNKEKEYPKIMAYTQVQEAAKFKELADQAKKWFRNWNKGKENNSEEYYDFYYDIRKSSDKNEIIFWRWHKDKWYSFELEYVFDETYLGPVLQVGYVWYKDTNWYGGVYYQAEGGRGYQRHIGAVGSSWYGNSEASINKDFVETFEGSDLSKFSKWWKILSKCSEEQYCRKTLEIPQEAPDYIGLPVNHYLNAQRDKWYDNYHPLQMQFSNINKTYKFDGSKFNHINSVKGIQR